MSEDERDRGFMRRALAVAERGWGHTAPNPMVGAVVVRDGEIVGQGHHAHFGGSHAEVNAIAAAGERANGAHLYVTLEPCTHHGKTPPCTDAIIRSGIAVVTIAAPEPSPAAGGGADVLRKSGIEVRMGLEEPAARELNAWFYNSQVSQRPWTILKLAVSLDAAIADAPAVRGERPGSSSRWLTDEPARAEVHRMRAGTDAIAVGIGTVLADDPQLTVRHWSAPRKPPVRVVFDRRARLPLESALVRTAHQAPTLAIVEREDLSGVDLLRRAGVEIVVADSLEAGLIALRERGVLSLLVEGGAAIAGALLDAGCVDRLVVFQAPVLLGRGSLNAFSAVTASQVVARRLRIIDRRELGADLMTVYALQES